MQSLRFVVRCSWKCFVVLALSVALLPQVAFAYSDTDPRAWYSTGKWVEYVTNKKLMTGYSPVSFGPEDAITRAQVATILYRYANPTSTATTNRSDYQSFNTTGLPDVEVGTYYTAAVNWAKENGVVTGYDWGLFGPENSVTREEICTMLARFAALQGRETGKASRATLETIPGYEHLATWSKKPLAWCTSEGIISGVEHPDHTITLEPRSTATRAQMAKMITVLMRDILGESTTPVAGKTWHEAEYQNIWIPEKTWVIDEPAQPAIPEQGHYIPVWYSGGIEFSSYEEARQHSIDSGHSLSASQKWIVDSPAKPATPEKGHWGNHPTKGGWERLLIKTAGWY